MDKIPHSRPWITPSDHRAILDQLNAEQIADGSSVSLFQATLSELTGLTEICYLNSGTAALHVALDALALRPGDEVILPTYVCYQVLEAVLAAGAKPVLCDLGSKWLITPDSIGDCLSNRTRAILLAGVFGFVTDVSNFRRFGVPIVVDHAQSFDELLLGNRVNPDLGDIVVGSLHAIKCLTTGVGGIVGAVGRAWREPLAHSIQKYYSLYKGADLGAALGLSQLKRYDEFRRRRFEIAKLYFDNLPTECTRALHGLQQSWHAFRFPLFQCKFKFDIFARAMEKQGVVVRRGVDQLLHRRLGNDDSKFPCAVESFDRTISIPIYPSMTAEQAYVVAQSFKEVWSGVL